MEPWCAQAQNVNFFFLNEKEFKHSCSVSNNEEETTFRLIPKKSEIIQSISFSFFKKVNGSEKM